MSRGPTALPEVTGNTRAAAAVSGGPLHALATSAHARSEARWCRAFSPFLLALVLGALPAAAQESPPPPPPSVPAQPPSPGSTPRSQPTLTDEDREVVENLELLESLDATEDLEVLLELSQKE